jgi:hypothetical protein
MAFGLIVMTASSGASTVGTSSDTTSVDLRAVTMLVVELLRREAMTVKADVVERTSRRIESKYTIL